MNAWGVSDSTAFADHHKMEFCANVINVMRGVARHENALKITCKGAASCVDAGSFMLETFRFTAQHLKKGAFA
ncbi:hypothetical protein [Corynebacterium diphtheriae]|uniref:hypothetical protein n=1 Tax=Corynebacterium diphtheriae TaxID=1717 RepID=UPI0015F5172E|nr:hypothetical protein [Corynebacterium diphtheriae]